MRARGALTSTMTPDGLKRRFRWTRSRIALFASLAALLIVLSGGCFSDDEGELYYGRVIAPRAHELRWSDGGVPQTFDPALAATPPDTDVVRALFEGLTDYDPRNLLPVSGVALHWESSSDHRLWTFYLRREARWSNGDPVTAQDFVRSWQRALRLGERAPHADLLNNIEGAKVEAVVVSKATGSASAGAHQEAAPRTPKNAEASVPAKAFGAAAINDHTLQVRLTQPDKNFPALVAHPVFRPVHQPGAAQEVTTEGSRNVHPGLPEQFEIKPPVVSNGAFQLAEQNQNSIILKRVAGYWNADQVQLERVSFVGAPDAEAALASYRAGEVDVVTNVSVEPLAIKLLSPYQDFRRETYSALTYYVFNSTRSPFDDLRVRQALALSVDRERLSADTLSGATEPAATFLPALSATGRGRDASPDGLPLEYSVEKARRLLADAGYASGVRFPRIRLLVNRNDQQVAVAKAVAKMWHNALGVETDIVVRGWDDYEATLAAGDYDIARRSMVMQTADEEISMQALFEGVAPTTSGVETGKAQPSNQPTPDASPKNINLPKDKQSTVGSQTLVADEARALRDLPGIPLYFASSYALVKPYVAGFDANLLDAPSLQHVRIDTAWQPPNAITFSTR